MIKEGFRHEGIFLTAKNHSFRIDFKSLVNKVVTVYGQTEVTKDLYSMNKKSNIKIYNCVKDVNPCDFFTENSQKPPQTPPQEPSQKQTAP